MTTPDRRQADGTAATPGRRRARLAVRTMGAAGFLFFLVKGLMWLSVPALFTCFAAR